MDYSTYSLIHSHHFEKFGFLQKVLEWRLILAVARNQAIEKGLLIVACLKSCPHLLLQISSVGERIFLGMNHVVPHLPSQL